VLLAWRPMGRAHGAASDARARRALRAWVRFSGEPGGSQMFI